MLKLHARVAAFLLAASFLTSNALSAPPSDGPPPGETARLLEAFRASHRVLAAPLSPSTPQVLPPVKYRWPLAWPATHPRLRITNYVDHDPTARKIDYEGGLLTYDGHHGTDFNVNTFRDMDDGVPIVAAASGYVFGVHDGDFDREVNAPNVPGNGVWILHTDGTATLYYHLRKNSATVRSGEYVREGQMVGFVGSSGFTEAPHLHFEVSLPAAPYTADPFSGSQNPIPSFWQSQEDYLGDDHLHVYDLGVTTGFAFSEAGSFQDWSAFKESPSQPVVVGADEVNLRIWTLVFGQVGDPYSFELHRPDGSLFTRVDDYAVPPTAWDWGRGWQYADVPFGANVSPADYGDWYVQVISGGVPVMTDHFTVGPTSIYAPRFKPAGRSFHLTGGRQEDVMTLSYLGTPYTDLTYTLENAPNNVSLTRDEYEQPVLVINPAGPDLFNVRSREFAVVATDPLGYQGRMRYHLVNDAASALGSSPRVTAPASVSANEGDTVIVDVSASDADGDLIELLYADLSTLPGNSATFVSGPGNTTGRLVWPTHEGDAGPHGVMFTARTAFGGGYVPRFEQTGSVWTLITVTRVLTAHTFVSAGDRLLRLASGKPQWCAALEPENFDLADIDLESVELVSPGTGSVDRIPAAPARRVVFADKDRNSAPDVTVCFGKHDLQMLFSGITGRQTLTPTIEGRLVSGESFSAPVSVDVLGGGGGPGAASISPNPLNPDAILTLNVSRPGSVRVRIYDTVGRLVRTIDRSNVAAGPLEMRIDAKDGAGKSLASGVYFFRVASGDGVTAGRFVVMK